MERDDVSTSTGVEQHDGNSYANSGARRSDLLLTARHLAIPVLILALPLFLWAGWGGKAWGLAATLWFLNRGIQWAVEKFVLDLPPTVAVAVAGVALLSRAWGVMIGLVLAAQLWDKNIAVPAAILFLVLYTIDGAARGLAWADTKRLSKEPTA